MNTSHCFLDRQHASPLMCKFPETNQIKGLLHLEVQAQMKLSDPPLVETQIRITVSVW